MSTEAEPPAGYLTLTAAVLTMRRRSASPALVPPVRSGEADRDVARAQLDELLALFVRMSQEQRVRLIEHAAAMLRPTSDEVVP
jgi:hypothetical protein